MSENHENENENTVPGENFDLKGESSDSMGEALEKGKALFKSALNQPENVRNFMLKTEEFLESSHRDLKTRNVMILADIPASTKEGEDNMAMMILGAATPLFTARIVAEILKKLDPSLVSTIIAMHMRSVLFGEPDDIGETLGGVH